MTFKAVIIDDEPSVAESLHKLIETFCGEIQVVAIANNVKDAIQTIKKVKPDLVFLDILMPQHDGFYLLEQFKPNYGFKCIFTTAHEEFAIKAIKYNALDYLLKPIDPDELIALTNRVKRQYHSENEWRTYITRLESFLNNNGNRRIPLPNGQDINWLRISEISYIHAEGNYCHLQLQSGEKMLVTRRLKYFEDQLGDSMFIRIHKSYLVNTHSIKGYSKSLGGFLIIDNGSELPVSDKHKQSVLKLLGLVKL
jgi:two-component system LytT family response regulator